MKTCFAALALIASTTVLADPPAQVRYAPGSLDIIQDGGPQSGTAINPRTGQRELVYATYGSPDVDTAGPPVETGFYFASNGAIPNGALSMAGALMKREKGSRPSSPGG